MTASTLAWALSQLDAGNRVAIASVVESQGSVPGKVGAKIAISLNGEQHGTVGGAGLEMMVIDHLQDVLNGEAIPGIERFQLRKEALEKTVGGRYAARTVLSRGIALDERIRTVGVISVVVPGIVRTDVFGQDLTDQLPAVEILEAAGPRGNRVAARQGGSARQQSGQAGDRKDGCFDVFHGFSHRRVRCSCSPSGGLHLASPCFCSSPADRTPEIRNWLRKGACHRNRATSAGRRPLKAPKRGVVPCLDAKDPRILHLAAAADGGMR